MHDLDRKAKQYNSEEDCMKMVEDEQLIYANQVAACPQPGRPSNPLRVVSFVQTVNPPDLGNHLMTTVGNAPMPCPCIPFHKLKHMGVY